MLALVCSQRTSILGSRCGRILQMFLGLVDSTKMSIMVILLLMDPWHICHVFVYTKYICVCICVFISSVPFSPSVMFNSLQPHESQHARPPCPSSTPRVHSDMCIHIRMYILIHAWGFPGGSDGKESTCQCRRCKRHGFDPWVGMIPWRKAWQPTPVILAWKRSWTEETAGLQSTGLQRVRHD